MNRDALVATLIGFAVGLALTALLLFGPAILAVLPKVNLPNISWPKKLPSFSKSSAPTPTQTPKSDALTIDSPVAETIEPKSSILVSGSSPTGSVVVIQTETEEVVVSPNGDGKYAGTVTLSEGYNEIIVTSYTSGTPTVKRVVVYYTPEEF